MKFRTLSLAIAGAFVLSAPAAFAQDSTDTAGSKRFSIAGGYAHIKPRTNAFDAPNTGVKGSGMPTLSAAYHITPNIAVEAWGAVDKSTHKIGGGSQVKAQPYAISGQYHFGQPEQAIRPYVGLGYYEANISGERDAAGNTFGMSTPKGAIGTIGADFNITDRVFTRAEARYMQGKSDVKMAGQKVGEAKLDPWVVGVGVGARF
ncbi:OmpW family protein [Lysobacter pythonis]|uniref:OmpW family protein n=1 Tax=Solilutibacter pythonis TaxID=2483112 RepID=A0A3M2HUX9_9GAMM|nr:OmpW family outer membrane protein [Lysobacter pythonis]RMH92828.1 OmpW family protein [Lysobacter pythonis]